MAPDMLQRIGSGVHHTNSGSWGSFKGEFSGGNDTSARSRCRTDLKIKFDALRLLFAESGH